MNALLSSHVALASTVPVCWHILYSKRIQVGICAENIYVYQKGRKADLHEVHT